MAKKTLRVRTKKAAKTFSRKVKKGYRWAKNKARDYDFDVDTNSNPRIIWITVRNKKTGKSYPIPIKT